jgi:carbonic anhydrase
MLAFVSLLPAALGAQTDRQEQQPPQHAKRLAGPVAIHRAQPELPPKAALRHLQQGNEDYLSRTTQHDMAARSGKQSTEARREPTRPRPAGAGRHVAAVIACADLQVDLPRLFDCQRKDLYILRTPAALTDAGTVAALESLVQKERLSLCIVLTHDACDALTTESEQPTPAQLSLRSRLRAALQLARRQDLPLGKAQARTQREFLLASSEVLRSAEREERIRIIGASLAEDGARVEWHVPRIDTLPIAPVK